MWPVALGLIGLSIIVFLTPTQTPNEVQFQENMTIPAKPSPLGPHKAISSCAVTSTSTSDPIAAKIREHKEARMAKHYSREPWLKKTPLQTSQMIRVRRRFCKVQSGFYWQAIRDNVMGEENRPTNRYFLAPLMDVATNNNPAQGHVAEKTMDFAKMTRKWDHGTYFGDSIAIIADFHVMVFNAEASYPPGHRVHEAATRLRAIFDEECSADKWSAWMNNAVNITAQEGLDI